MPGEWPQRVSEGRWMKFWKTESWAGIYAPAGFTPESCSWGQPNVGAKYEFYKSGVLIYWNCFGEGQAGKELGGQCCVKSQKPQALPCSTKLHSLLKWALVTKINIINYFLHLGCLQKSWLLRSALGTMNLLQQTQMEGLKQKEGKMKKQISLPKSSAEF